MLLKQTTNILKLVLYTSCPYPSLLIINNKKECFNGPKNINLFAKREILQAIAPANAWNMGNLNCLGHSKRCVYLGSNPTTIFLISINATHSDGASTIQVPFMSRIIVR